MKKAEKFYPTMVDMVDIDKIREQVEFYFSDSNYARDKFLQEVAIRNDRKVPILTVISFTRMKNLDATVDNVKEALANSEIVEVVDESLRKRDTKEYQEYRACKELDKRIVHMSGFPVDYTLDNVKDLLRRADVTPVKINMRRNSEKSFTGSCYVEFYAPEEAQAVIARKIEVPVATSKDELGEEENENEQTKKQKTSSECLVIVSKEDHQNSVGKQPPRSRVDSFADKVKSDFIPKLYKYESSAPLNIADIKTLVKNVAFVDTERKVLRMKYREDWEHKEFEKDGKKVNLTKMTEDEAKKYVDTIEIKKKGRKAPKKSSSD